MYSAVILISGYSPTKMHKSTVPAAAPYIPIAILSASESACASADNELIVAFEIKANECIGSKIRCCVGLGCTAIVLIGSFKYTTHGSHGSDKHINFIHFYYWHEFVEYCRSRSYIVYGIVPTATILTPDARASASVEKVVSFQSSSKHNVVFITSYLTIDNWNEEAVAACTELIHVSIPNACVDLQIQYNAKISIVLHHYTSVTSYQERTVIGEKYTVAATTRGRYYKISPCVDSSNDITCISTSIFDTDDTYMNTLYGDEDEE